MREVAADWTARSPSVQAIYYMNRFGGQKIVTERVEQIEPRLTAEERQLRDRVTKGREIPRR